MRTNFNAGRYNHFKDVGLFDDRVVLRLAGVVTGERQDYVAQVE